MRDLIHPANRVHQSPKAGALETVAQRAGDAVHIRSASSEDKERLRGMFSRLSLKTIYQRFHAPYPRVPEWAVASFIGGDRRKEVLVALAGGDIVGHAMYVRSEDEREAEFAVLVEDAWQAKGVGKLLLSELAERAERLGIQTFTGIVLGENRRMLGLIGALFTGTRFGLKDGVYNVHVPLQSPEPVKIAG